MTASSDSKQVTFESEDGFDTYILTFAYGPVYTLEQNNGTTKTFASLDEVRLNFAGVDPRPNRNYETFKRLATAYLKANQKADTATLVESILGFTRGEEKNPSSGFSKGRNWLAKMEDEGLIVSLETASTGKRGKPAPLFELDTQEAREARENAAQELVSRQHQLDDDAETLLQILGGNIGVNYADMVLTLDEEAVAKLLQLVNVPATATR